MSQQNNPLYSDRTKIQRGLMSFATRVDSPDDQSLLVDAANWMSKYGLGPRGHRCRHGRSKATLRRCYVDGA